MRKIIAHWWANNPEKMEDPMQHPFDWAAENVFFVSPKTLRRKFKYSRWSYDTDIERASKFYKSTKLSEAMGADQVEWMQKEKEESQ